MTQSARAMSPQAARELCRLGFDISAIGRSLEPGFLGIRCVVDIRDPRKVLVYQEWGSRAAFDEWFTSEPRPTLRRQLAYLIEGD